eukprot:gene16331-biopygen13576
MEPAEYPEYAEYAESRVSGVRGVRGVRGARGECTIEVQFVCLFEEAEYPEYADRLKKQQLLRIVRGAEDSEARAEHRGCTEDVDCAECIAHVEIGGRCC